MMVYGTNPRMANESAGRLLSRGQHLAALSVGANVLLAALNIVVGLAAHSTSAVAVGIEFAGDVFSAGLVYAGFIIARRPPDLDHPYGHGRAETVAGLVLGVILVLMGLSIASQSLRNYDMRHAPPDLKAVYPLVVSVFVKGGLMAAKFRLGRKIRSSALVADGWNDSIDVLSGSAALVALTLTLVDPARFLAADHFGGFAVGLLVIVTGLGVSRDTSLELMDTMPPKGLMDRIRASARSVDRVRGVEKCWARKTGLRYHVDIHIEVDPHMSLGIAHGVAEEVRVRIKHEIADVADVLVHVEPATDSIASRSSRSTADGRP